MIHRIQDVLGQTLRIVTVSPTVSSLTFADLDDYFFRINWTTRDNAEAYAKYYYERGIRRISAAIDANNRVFSESWLREFQAAFEVLGGAIVTTDIFDASEARGYSDTAQKLLEADEQAILLVANSIDTAQLAQQVRKLDRAVLLIAAEWAASERLLFLGGSAIDGLELVQSYNRDDRSASYLPFLDAYRDQFQQEPGYSAIAAHDAATMLFTALRERRDDQPLRDVMLALGTIQGLQQPIAFNRFGDAQRRAFFVVVRDGQFEPL
jgi:branched-chain amino acid transport system substrate-binding protein